jgi:transmembrane sensor
MSEEKYKEALKRSESITREILSDPERLITEEVRLDYMQRKLFMQKVNTRRAWLRFTLRVHRRLIVNTAAAAAAILVFMIVLFRFGGEQVQEIAQAEILPAHGVVTVRLSSGEVLTLDSVSSERIGVAMVDPANSVISYQQQETPGRGRSRGEEEYNELTIPKGRSFSLTLSDGTRVWVNSQSSVRYPVAFYGEERVVYLEGEAYFDVAHNAAAPFVVATSEQRVHVLGTRFNIKSYNDEGMIATTLISGAVSVSCTAGRERRIYPGEQLSFSKADRSFTVEEVDTDVYTAWIENKLIMNRTPLIDITSRLQRRYNIVFEYSDEELKHETFTGDIPLNDNLGVILRQLARVSSARFELRDNIVMIKK